MNNLWKQHYECEIGSWPIRLEIHSLGGFRVWTTQAEDDGGIASIDDFSVTTVVAPTSEGRKVKFEGDTIAKLKQDLEKYSQFDIQQIHEIVSHFPNEDDGVA